MKIQLSIKEKRKEDSMSKPLDRFEYAFGDIVMVGTRRGTEYKTTWYLKCPQCRGEHMFRQTGSAVWHTSCVLTGIEWTITPREVYTCKPTDLTLILGDRIND